MVIPFIASVMRDVFEVTSRHAEGVGLRLGCTTWEVVWNVVLPYTKVGVSAASCWAWAARWAKPWRSPS
jgi:phosphate transport system permease protein